MNEGFAPPRNSDAFNPKGMDVFVRIVEDGPPGAALEEIPKWGEFVAGKPVVAPGAPQISCCVCGEGAKLVEAGAQGEPVPPSQVLAFGE